MCLGAPLCTTLLVLHLRMICSGLNERCLTPEREKHLNEWDGEQYGLQRVGGVFTVILGTVTRGTLSV